MNVVFIGASKFGLRCLDLISHMPNINVTGVVTAPQKFSISYRPEGVTNVLHADIYSLAKKNKIPVVTLKKNMHEAGLLSAVRTWNPSIFLVVGWYHMIPKAWRETAIAYGMHASLLPDYSGGAPLVWAMINGEDKTGITLFQIDEKVDSGPIVGQLEEPIHKDDTIATLYSRIEERGIELLREVMPKIAIGEVEPVIQNESRRRVMPQRSPEDGLIDWSWDVEMIDRFVRAQTKPYPGAFTTCNGRRVTILAGTPVPAVSHGYIFGNISKVNGEYGIGCRNGYLALDMIELQEKIYQRHELFNVFD